MKYIRHSIFFIILFLIILSSVHRPSIIDRSIGALPVLHDGRIKPMDTLARHTLLQIQGRLRLASNASPVQWFFSMMSSPAAFKNEPIILVEHPKLFDSIDPKYRKQKYRVSEAFLNENFDLIQPFIASAALLEKEERTPFQQAAYLLANRYQSFASLRYQFFPFEENSQLNFWNQMLLLTQSMNKANIQSSPEFDSFLAYYDQLKSSPSTTRLIFDKEWSTLPDSALDPSQSKKNLLSHYLLLSDAYNERDLDLISTYSKVISDEFRQFDSIESFLVHLEYMFNQLNPFIVSLFIYCFIILLVFLTRFFNLKFGTSYIRMAWLVALSFHSFGLIARMIILMRPPVINLYSSAIFIAFVASFIGYILYKRAHHLFYAGYISALSALSLIAAYHLSLSGDTLQVMQAVLNSNFWLGTHVVSMTIGYAVIFMAGFFAIAYVLIGTLTRFLTHDFSQQLERLVYVFLMISLFFNLLGTVLGGIWADQSWGRFWGWDPKENGAILIVLWIGIILHMRWGKLLSARGTMLMTIVSNVVTAWSWKGTNMLGIGLHSYGFTEKTFYWLMMFFISQIAIIVLGCLPKKYWLSFHNEPDTQ
jgi:ABC-type transport system involved in cytochrome c biogenesis permease subunit